MPNVGNMNFIQQIVNFELPSFIALFLEGGGKATSLLGEGGTEVTYIKSRHRIQAVFRPNATSGIESAVK